MTKALQCIAPQKRFVLSYFKKIKEDTEYSVSLQDGASIPIGRTPDVFFIAGQSIEVYRWPPENPGEQRKAEEKFRVRALSYTYAFSTFIDGNELELLTFQWRRHPVPGRPSDYPLGHLHIGPALFSSPCFIRDKDFHKAHIPTERLSFESIVRFAIVELGISAEDKWQETLETSESAWRQHRTA